MRGRAVSMARVRAMIAGGMSVREAAISVGACPNTIWRHVRAAGLKLSGRRAPHPHPGMLAILAAMRSGLRTAPEIAKATGKTRNCATLSLIYMEDRGLVRRHGYAVTKCGRPPIVWQIAEAAQ